MLTKSITQYSGEIIHDRFAYRFLRDKVSPIGDIVAFRGPMEVLAEHMIDQEDLLNEAFIWSDDAMNFIWEMPILGNNPFGAVAYQQLLNTQIAKILMQEPFLNRRTIMKGDDIVVPYQTKAGENKLGKCSVSITYVKNNAALGHTGINIVAGNKAPDFAYSTYFSDTQAEKFMQHIIDTFYHINQKLFIATSKVLV